MTLNLNPIALMRAAVLAGLSLSAVSCVSGPPYQPDGNVFITDKPPRYGYQGTNSPGDSGPNKPNERPKQNVGEDPSKLHDPNTNNKPSDTASNPTSDAPPSTTPSTDPTATTPEPKATKPSTSLPFGTPVIGRKGYVYSPYAPDKGMVDVVDVPSGTKVECPYTGKAFRVP